MENPGARIKWTRTRNNGSALELSDPNHGARSRVTDMNPQPVLGLLLRCLLLPVLVRSAPLVSPSNQLPSIRALAGRAKTLVEKILRDLPGVHNRVVTAEGLDFNQEQMTNLQVMTSSLGIPSHPVLKPPSDSFTLDLCVGHMMSGAQLYHNMLQVLSKNEPGLRDLGLDLRDLHTHITKIKDTGRLGDAALQNLPALTDTLHDDYQVQLAIHMVLLKLHSFCHDLMRSLRAIATYRLHPVASPSPSTT